MGDDLLFLVNEYADKCFYLFNEDDYIFTNANGGRLDEKAVYEIRQEFPILVMETDQEFMTGGIIWQCILLNR